MNLCSMHRKTEGKGRSPKTELAWICSKNLLHRLSPCIKSCEEMRNQVQGLCSAGCWQQLISRLCWTMGKCTEERICWRNHHISLPGRLIQNMFLYCEIEMESLEQSVMFQAVDCQRYWKFFFMIQSLSIMNTCHICTFHRLQHFYPHCGITVALLTQRGGEKREALGSESKITHPKPQNRCGRTRSECRSPEGEARSLIINFLNFTHPSSCLSNYPLLLSFPCSHLIFESAWASFIFSRRLLCCQGSP